MQEMFAQTTDKLSQQHIESHVLHTTYEDKHTKQNRVAVSNLIYRYALLAKMCEGQPSLGATCQIVH